MDDTVSSRSAQEDAVPGDGRNETPSQRYDRNWDELLQEFRVLQTGTQILAGFLLTLPFQQRFTELGPGEHVVYLCLVVVAALVALLALAPVTLHRLLFRRRAKRVLVSVSHRILIACLAAASLLFVGIVAFVFDVVISEAAALVAGGAMLLLVVAVWIIAPITMMTGRDRRP